ncbi:MAG: SagB/ThcOx family dehydrogenase [Acidobacteriota bacterium]
MRDAPNHDSPSLETVLDYHQDTKHHFQRYARGPGDLDWATQPDPFRRYQGAPVVALQKTQPQARPLYDEAFAPDGVPPRPISFESISELFYHSLALSAWKTTGEHRWALRVNPSSGNLHPTEGYLITGPVEGLCQVPVVCHYTAREHALETRARLEIPLWEELCRRIPGAYLFIALTSIHWREAWKYGQRAYRYCQHDVGHALGAIAVAAAGMGWKTWMVDDLSTHDLSWLTGTFFQHDAEPEEPDLLIAIAPGGERKDDSSPTRGDLHAFASLEWLGTPNPLSPHNLDWDIDPVATACRRPRGPANYQQVAVAGAKSNYPARPVSLAQVIAQRRSAVEMDGTTRISRETFYRILLKTLPCPGRPPFNTLPWKPHIHLAIFVHRVVDLASGLYLLVRDPSKQPTLEAAIVQGATWREPPGCPEGLRLFQLIEGDLREKAKQVSCFQGIAGDGCFSLAMIAEYETPIQRYGPCFYPRLFWEAGLIGQVLYLEAEAAGIRSTGIGCYFDDAMHEFLGLQDHAFQDLYHFTVGGAVEDIRLTTLPPYPEASAD